MEQKSKFFIFALAGLLIIVGVFFAQTYSSKQMIQRDRDDLKRENESLSIKINKLETGLRDYENRISSLNKEIDKASQEKQDLEAKLALANKDKQSLIDRLKEKAEQAAKAVPEVPPQAVVPANTDAYWAGILKAKTDLEMQLSSIRTDLKSAQLNAGQLSREKNSLELDINNLKHDNEDLVRQLAYNQKLMDGIGQELVREKNDKMQIQEADKSVRSENKVLLKQLKGLTAHKADLEEKLQDLKGKKEDIEHKLGQMQQTLTAKISQVDTLREKFDNIQGEANARVSEGQEKTGKSAVELPAIIVRPPQQMDAPSQSPAGGLTGKILAINKNANFVIIDLGEESGVNVGNAFKVYRDGNVIANLEVIQVRQSIAACDIKKEMSPVKIGDSVR